MESWLDISIEILSCLLTLRRVRSSGNAKDDLESLCNYRPLRFPDNFTEEGKKRLDGQGRDFHREVFLTASRRDHLSFCYLLEKF